MAKADSFAIILVQLGDQASAPFDRAHAVNMFTGAGRGTRNIVDYFDDMSWGQYDIADSEVFGWYKTTQTLQDQVDRVAFLQAEDKKNGTNLWHGTIRGETMALGRGLAVAAGVDLSAFRACVIIFGGPYDVFGTVGTAVLNYDPNNPTAFFSLDLTIAAHEMLHALGLEHSAARDVGADYTDPWDIMSAYGVHEADANSRPPATYVREGPGLCAANMDAMGWLAPHRVASVGQSRHGRFTLRPLHRHDLSGYLAATVAGYFVEFRKRESWDRGIPGDTVLVHVRDHGRAELVPAPSTRPGYEMAAGDILEIGIPGVTRYVRIEVVSLNAGANQAVVDLGFRPQPNWEIHAESVGRLLGGIAVGGGGLIIDRNGQPIPVPPDSYHAEILDALVDILQTEQATRRLDDAKVAKLAHIARLNGLVSRLAGAEKTFSTPAKKVIAKTKKSRR